MPTTYTKAKRPILGIMDGVGVRVGWRLRNPPITLVVELEEVTLLCCHDFSYIVFCFVVFQFVVAAELTCRFAR